jgi:hypothetical protein
MSLHNIFNFFFTYILNQDKVCSTLTYMEPSDGTSTQYNIKSLHIEISDNTIVLYLLLDNRYCGV